VPARPGRALLVTTLLRMAPIFPVSNLAVALAHYGRLGSPPASMPMAATVTRPAPASNSTSV
jgi:hypothetical protein